MNKDDSNFIRNKADAVDYVSAPACAQSCTTQESPLGRGYAVAAGLLCG